MLRTAMSKRAALAAILVFVTYFAPHACAREADVISLKDLKPDRACGPRCLYTFMHVTGQGMSECDIECIYKLIGVEPLSPTSLLELKKAAEQLGLDATGYKLTIKGLQKIKGYAILPIGQTTGAPDDPLHFILVKPGVSGYVRVIDPRTLKAQALPTSDLTKSWEGQALVLSAPDAIEDKLKKEPHLITTTPEKARELEYEQIKDFGLVDAGSVLTHTFAIPPQADSPADAEILAKSCSCVDADLGLDPNGRLTLTMELRIDKPALQMAYVVVNLPATGELKRYALRAYGKDTFRLTPKIGHIMVPDGGIVTYPVRIDYFTDANDEVRFESIKSSMPNLKAGTVKSENSSDAETRTFSFTVPLIFDAGEKPAAHKTTNGAIDFVLNSDKGQRLIPFKLSAEIGAEKYRLTPQRVFVLTSKSAGSIKRKLKLEFLMQGAPASIAVTSNGTLPLETQTTRLPDNSHIIDLAVSGDSLRNMPLGMNKDELIITPTNPAFCPDIAVPVTIFIRE